MNQPSPNCRVRLAYVALFVAWAGLYLPALGALELQGEEGRRALPGLTMLEGGNWLVPEVGGEVYFRKPPLINWMVALSVMVTGEVSEWSVRLPSVLAILALGLGILHASCSWLGLPGALMASLIVLTCAGSLGKGRLIEIEAIYISLFGLALVYWLRDWMGGQPLRGWVLAGLFLGLGMLAKGPPHLLFFYAIVSGVIVGTRDGRHRAVVAELLKPRALTGFGLALGLFVLWSALMLRAIEINGDAGLGSEAAGTWWQQLAARLGFEKFNFWKWWENLFRSAIINFLPWSLLFPLVWHKPLVESMEASRRRLYLGMRGGLLFGWLAIALLPGSSPRYTLPLLVPASLLVAMALVEWSRNSEPAWLLRAWRWTLIPLLCFAIVCGLGIPFYSGFSGFHILAGMTVAFAGAMGVALAMRLAQPVSLVLVSSLCFICMVAVFSVAIVPRMSARDELRPMAREVKAVLPSDAKLGFFRPNYQPLLFYLPRPVHMVLSTDELRPPTITHLLVRERHMQSVRQRRDWKEAPTLATLHDLDDQPLYLLERAR